MRIEHCWGRSGGREEEGRSPKGSERTPGQGGSHGHGENWACLRRVGKKSMRDLVKAQMWVGCGLVSAKKCQESLQVSGMGARIGLHDSLS